VRQLDKQGRLTPSACSEVPRAPRVACSHPFLHLKWVANDSAAYAKCTRCGLRHTIYYDTASQTAYVSGVFVTIKEAEEPPQQVEAGSSQTSAGENTQPPGEQVPPPPLGEPPAEAEEPPEAPSTP
jgi:hypothetical protein